MDSIEGYLNHYLNLSERIEFFKKRKQFSAEIELTNHCNLNCRYCYLEAVNEKGTFLDHSFVLKVINDLDQAGIREIGWIGGEPLLYKKLKELMEYSSSKDIQNVLYTNGALISEKNVEWIARECKTGRIVIHLDSVNYQNYAHGQAKPSEIKYQKAMASFDLLINAGFPADRIILTIPLSKSCYETAEETMQFVADKGIQFINLIALTALGRSEEYNEFITKDQIKETFEKRNKILNKPWLDQLGVCEYCKQFQLTDFSIGHSGDVYPYIDDFRSQGNIKKDDNLIEILDRSADVLSYSQWVNEDSTQNIMEGACQNCRLEKYCFGDPITSPSGKMDHDCWLTED